MIGGVVMKDLLLVTLLFLLLVSTSFGLTAVAENGKTVILNANGTWKYDTTSEWRVVRSYKGSSSKNTDLFSVSGNPWRIRVISKTSMLTLALFIASSGDVEEIVINMNGPGTDETCIYRKGNFYLDIIAYESYEK
jgi:hypothetical protein